MTSFQFLPSELLVPIFKHLSRSDLRALSTVSPYFCEVAQSSLYAKIELWWDATYTPCILSLLNALVRRPKLAQHVHELVLDGNKAFYYHVSGSHKQNDLMIPPKLSLDKVTAAEMQALESASPTFTSLSDKQRWVEGVQQGSMDAFVTLLISLLPHLQSIKISNNFAEEINILGSFLRSALVPGVPGQSTDNEEGRFSSALSQVQNITYCLPLNGDGTCHPYDSTDILPLFYLPKLREMTARLTNPTHFSWPSTKPPDARGLVKLHLTRIREHNLEPILRQTTRLESFHWTWSWDYYGEPALRSPVIDLEKFYHGLSHVRGTLKDLTIRAELDPYRGKWGSVPQFTIHGSMKPLKEYEHLCSVGANPGVFLGFIEEREQPSMQVLSVPELSMSDVLPSSVERVTFYCEFSLMDYNPWQEADIVQIVNGWLSESLQDTPLLHDVQLHMADDNWSGWSQSALDELGDICRRFGIKFKEVSGAMTIEQWEEWEEKHPVTDI